MSRDAYSRTSDLSDLFSTLGDGGLPALLLNASTAATSLQAQLPTLSTNIAAVKGPLSSAVAAMGGSLEFTRELGVAISVGSALASVKGSMARAVDVTATLPAQPQALGSARAAWTTLGSADVVGNVTQLQLVLRNMSAMVADATRQGQTLSPADWQATVRLSLPRLAALQRSASTLRGAIASPVTAAVTAATALGPYATRVLGIACGDRVTDSVQSASAALATFAAASPAHSRLTLLRSGLSLLSPLMGPLATAVNSTNTTARSVQPLLSTFSATWSTVAAGGIGTLRDAANSLKEIVARAVDSFDSKVTGLMVQASQAVAGYVMFSPQRVR